MQPLNLNLLRSVMAIRFPFISHPLRMSVTSKWIFGDGETSTLPSPVHNYNAKGTLYPALWLKNNTCEVTLMNEPVYVSLVTAAFDFPDNRTVFCQYEEIQVINQSVGYQDITWIIQDTLIVREPELAPIALSSAGTLQIKLIVSDANGCSDSITKSITIAPLPEFDNQWGYQYMPWKGFHPGNRAGECRLECFMAAFGRIE